MQQYYPPSTPDSSDSLAIALPVDPSLESFIGTFHRIMTVLLSNIRYIGSLYRPLQLADIFWLREILNVYNMLCGPHYRDYVALKLKNVTKFECFLKLMKLIHHLHQWSLNKNGNIFSFFQEIKETKRLYFELDNESEILVSCIFLGRISNYPALYELYNTLDRQYPIDNDNRLPIFKYGDDIQRKIEEFMSFKDVSVVRQVNATSLKQLSNISKTKFGSINLLNAQQWLLYQSDAIVESVSTFGIRNFHSIHITYELLRQILNNNQIVMENYNTLTMANIPPHVPDSIYRDIQNVIVYNAAQHNFMIYPSFNFKLSLYRVTHSTITLISNGNSDRSDVELSIRYTDNITLNLNQSRVTILHLFLNSFQHLNFLSLVPTKYLKSLTLYLEVNAYSTQLPSYNFTTLNTMNFIVADGITSETQNILHRWLLFQTFPALAESFCKFASVEDVQTLRHTFQLLFGTTRNKIFFRIKHWTSGKCLIKTILASSSSIEIYLDFKSLSIDGLENIGLALLQLFKQSKNISIMFSSRHMSTLSTIIELMEHKKPKILSITNENRLYLSLHKQIKKEDLSQFSLMDHKFKNLLTVAGTNI